MIGIGLFIPASNELRLLVDFLQSRARRFRNLSAELRENRHYLSRDSRLHILKHA
jgi:hypothetical protein